MWQLIGDNSPMHVAMLGNFWGKKFFSTALGLLGLGLLVLLGSSLWSTEHVPREPERGLLLRAPEGVTPPVSGLLGTASDSAGHEPLVTSPVSPVRSAPVRELPRVEISEEATTRDVRRSERDSIVPHSVEGQRLPDTLVSRSLSSATTPNPILDFEGIPTIISLAPPDPVGDAGPNHYVQMVNFYFSVFNKMTGATILAPVLFNALWSGTGTVCALSNEGDPIVLYDEFADRWLISQFKISANTICVAISTSPDPTGAYYLYDLPMPLIPDYPKYGVWPSAYFLGTSSNDGTYAVTALDRASMVVGAPATTITFPGLTAFPLPADFDGTISPPASAPGLFYAFKDNAHHGPEGTGIGDRIEVYEFTPDFAVPGNSTFGMAAAIPIADFNYTVCGFFAIACIPQPGTTNELQDLSWWPMHRLQYRNFGFHETLVGNFTVDVTGTGHAGIRWFELRKVPAGTGSWILHQEGTHAPDAHHRWMGSIAMNKDGVIALGYSVASHTLFPSLRYAVRLPTDPLGTLRNEATLIAGGGSQTSPSRWGDYSSMNIDASDDQTFWYTGEYYGSTHSYNWKTRIGKIAVRSQLFVEVRAFLEGAYSSGVMRTDLLNNGYIPNKHPFAVPPWSYLDPDSVDVLHKNAVDWVLLSLIVGDPKSPPMTLVAQRAGLLTARSLVVDTNFVGAVEFNVSPDSDYYLVVSTRNHLPVMSTNPLEVVDSLAVWDFTSGAGSAWPGDGTALKSLPGGADFGLVACDLNSDGQITAADFNLWLTDTKAGVTGYLMTDCNLDGQVTAIDFNEWLKNTKAAYSSEVPEF